MKRSVPGPSPRAWGIRWSHFTILFDWRSIPTCVGNTRASPPQARRRTVHPHVRGEYGTEPGKANPSFGPSPRAWGIRSRRYPFASRRRSIPTCVGNTVGARIPPRPLPVHPHVRGEYSYASVTPACRNGPSPRAWGIPKPARVTMEVSRSIPTCVGNTLSRTGNGCSTAVHPHVRGEYSTHASRRWWGCGPSPRAWGIPPLDSPPCSGRRSIPTCVGNTSRALSPRSQAPVHPHVRGEYAGDEPVPRLRSRSIPTCVGNTDAACRELLYAAVHPHVRGEYWRRWRTPRTGLGPSPRAWGILSGWL